MNAYTADELAARSAGHFDRVSALRLLEDQGDLTQHHGGRSTRRVQDAAPDSSSVIKRNKAGRLTDLSCEVVRDDLHEPRCLHVTGSSDRIMREVLA